MKPKVAIIILNWNGKDDTLECLASVYQLDYPNFEVIVVDNGSTDGSPEAIRGLFPGVTLIENGTNLGYAGGNNVGMRYALEKEADYIWLLNNDTTVEPDSLSKLVAHAEDHLEVGMLSPVIYYYDAPEEVWFAGGRIDWRTGRTYHVREPVAFTNLDPRERYICGCAILVRREVIERIGLFDERFRPAYYEDTDWSVQCTNAGYKLAVVSASKIYHKVAKSSGSRKTERFRRLLTAARFFFMKKHQDCYGKGAGYHRKFIAGCIENYVTLLKYNARDEAQGVFNALIDVYQNTWILKNRNVKKTVQRTILRHPYFWANVIRGDWAPVLRSINRKLWSSTAG